MNPRRNVRTASCLAVCLLATGWLSAGTATTAAPAMAEFSICETAQLASPDGRWTLVGNFVDGACPASAAHPAEGARDLFAAQHANDFGVVLYLEDAASHARRPVDFEGHDGEAVWSPTGEAFYVNSSVGSNVSMSWLYYAGTLRRIDIFDAVRRSDQFAARFMTGHAYFRSRQWLDSRTAMVQLCGHTDNEPSQQFDLRYSVGLDGHTRRLSTQVRPVTDENILQECE